jgi:hypothetical protein
MKRVVENYRIPGLKVPLQRNLGVDFGKAGEPLSGNRRNH